MLRTEGLQYCWIGLGLTCVDEAGIDMYMTRSCSEKRNSLQTYLTVPGQKSMSILQPVSTRERLRKQSSASNPLAKVLATAQKRTESEQTKASVL